METGYCNTGFSVVLDAEFSRWGIVETEDGKATGGDARRSTIKLFLVCGFDLLDEGVDFFGGQFAGVFRHAALAIGDDVAQVVGGGRGGFVGDERRAAHEAALGGLAVTLGAVFLIDGVRGEGSARWGLGGSGHEGEEQGTGGDGELERFQVEPR